MSENVSSFLVSLFMVAALFGAGALWLVDDGGRNRSPYHLSE